MRLGRRSRSRSRSILTATRLRTKPPARPPVPPPPVLHMMQAQRLAGKLVPPPVPPPPPHPESIDLVDRLVVRVVADSDWGLHSNTFTIKPTTRLGELMKAWCSLQGIDRKEAYFTKLGETMQEDMTIAGSSLCSCPGCGEVIFWVLPVNPSKWCSTPSWWTPGISALALSEDDVPKDQALWCGGGGGGDGGGGSWCGVSGGWLLQAPMTKPGGVEWWGGSVPQGAAAHHLLCQARTTSTSEGVQRGI